MSIVRCRAASAACRSAFSVATAELFRQKVFITLIEKIEHTGDHLVCNAFGVLGVPDNRYKVINKLLCRVCHCDNELIKLFAELLREYSRFAAFRSVDDVLHDVGFIFRHLQLDGEFLGRFRTRLVFEFLDRGYNFNREFREVEQINLLAAYHIHEETDGISPHNPVSIVSDWGRVIRSRSAVKSSVSASYLLNLASSAAA